MKLKKERTASVPRQRKLDFYEHVIKDSDRVAKRKAVAKDEEDPMKRKRGHEGAGAPTHASSAGQNTSSSSSSGCIVNAGGDVIGVQRGVKRAAEDPPADCGDNDPVDEKGETEQQEGVSMDCMSFQEYCDGGGLWMVACREPEEDVEDAESSGAFEQDSCEAQFWDNRTGKPLDAEKVRAARAEELRELDRRVWEEADLQECFDKKGRGPIGIRWVDVDKGFGVYRSRLVAKDFKPRSKIDDKEWSFRSHASA